MLKVFILHIYVAYKVGKWDGESNTRAIITLLPCIRFFLVQSNILLVRYKVKTHAH